MNFDRPKAVVELVQPLLAADPFVSVTVFKRDGRRLLRLITMRRPGRELGLSPREPL